MQKPVRQAIVADSNIRITLRMLYGRTHDPEKYRQILHTEEFELLFSENHFTKVQEILKTLPEMPEGVERDTSIVRDYSKMRKALKISVEQLFQNYRFADFFGNSPRDQKISGLESKINNLKSQENFHSDALDPLRQKRIQLDTKPDAEDKWQTLSNVWQKYHNSLGWFSIESFIHHLFEDKE